MKAEWSFRAMSRSEMNVDPNESEFFTTEALEGITEALVRESGQNSLDAAINGNQVYLRFWLSGSENAISSQAATRYFPNLKEHLAARDSGAKSVPDGAEEVTFLVIEDFGTRGLLGDPCQEKDKKDIRNDFYYFWRNVGRSGKGQKDRGRWGLGKNVFPASSRINSFFGLTIREESPLTLLMGQSVLKVHELNGCRHYPYGYFGLIQGDGFASPIEEPSFIQKFISDFGVSRSTESGLSIIVPFPDSEITQDRIIRAAVRQFFYPILSNALVVSVASNGSEMTLNRRTLLEIVGSFDEAFRRELDLPLKLSEWACANAESSIIEVKQPSVALAPKWTEDALDLEILSNLRIAFERGHPLAFRVPVWVRAKRAETQESHFDVYLQRDVGMENHRPTFIREGIIVTDASKSKQRGVCAVVVVHDKPLGTLLGDAENPAHTEWQERSGHFKDRYHHGASVLRYVKGSVNALVQLLTHSQEESDPKVLIDIFSLPKPRESHESQSKEERPKPGAQPSGPAPELPVTPRSIRVSQIEGGFTIAQGQKAIAIPELIRVIVAYEVRRGNPFKRYQPADFGFDKPPINVVVDSAALFSAFQNELVLTDLGPGFKVTVTGFDPARDLIVRTAIEETKDVKTI